MLPFLKNKEKSIAGLIVKTRAPDDKPESDEGQDDSSAAMESCAQAIIAAVHAKDAKSLADALMDALECADASKDGVEPHSYDAQNIKAGENE